jgi:serine/threonine-protein phosphatase 6 regulatory ankyrin repeat subunit B
MFASEKGNSDVVDLLLPKIDIDNVNLQNKDGWTALMLASYHGHINIINLLINYGADVNLKDNDLRTAYDLAKTNEIKFLLTERR